MSRRKQSPEERRIEWQSACECETLSRLLIVSAGRQGVRFRSRRCYAFVASSPQRLIAKNVAQHVSNGSGLRQRCIKRRTQIVFLSSLELYQKLPKQGRAILAHAQTRHHAAAPNRKTHGQKK